MFIINSPLLNIFHVLEKFNIVGYYKTCQAIVLFIKY